MVPTHVNILEVFALHEPLKNIGQPFVAGATKGSWPQRAIFKSWTLSMNRHAPEVNGRRERLQRFQ
jgi:hypothetical protein